MSETKNTGLSFDARTVEPQAAFDPIPAGWYNVEITDAEILATKGRNGGSRVKVEFTVLDGEFKGRKVFGSINNKNTNAQAQEIGQRELSALCHATGVIVIEDLKQFVGKMLQVKVRVKPATAEYDAANEPRGYKALEGAAPPSMMSAPPAPGAPPMPPAPPAAVPAPPASFPPAGWVAHPQAPGWFYEVANPANMKEAADLQASLAPAAPVAPPAPIPAPPAPAPAPVPLPPAPAPAAVFPPEGWTAHPQSPGYFYNAAGEVLAEADLRARVSGPAGIPPLPGAATDATPPWAR
jgi:Protein of unknown function (DUF669)